MLSSKTATQKPVPNILVVDDEPDNRRLLNRILSRTGRITEAPDGRTALDLLAAETFDLVLLDIMMPDMTGLDVLQHIRRDHATADLPVILISALAESDDIVRGLQLAANDYIVKPIDIDVVMARVDTHLKLKQTSDLQKQAIVELEAAQQMKDRLLKIASHDMRAPLSNIRLAQLLLRDHVPGNADANELLDILEATVVSMQKIIDEFLDVSAVKTTGIGVTLGEVEIAEVVGGVVAQFSRMAFDKQIALVLDDLPGVVTADHARLEQALNNLVSNAIKYSPRGSTIRLASSVDSDRARITVADQGPGIREDERDRLFLEFSKLSTRPTGGEASTGLGLWIVKQMMNVQGGETGADFPESGGSVFWVELPTA